MSIFMRSVNAPLAAILFGLAVGSALPASADDLIPPCWRGRPGTTFQHWRFDTNTNPASPELVNNPNGS